MSSAKRQCTENNDQQCGNGGEEPERKTMDDCTMDRLYTSNGPVTDFSVGSLSTQRTQRAQECAALLWVVFVPTCGVDSLHWPKRAQKQVTKRESAGPTYPK